jgi:hypothetical protein
LNRRAQAEGLARVNHKRVYRVMKRAGLLLAPHTGRGRQRPHDGEVATAASNRRWAADVFEIPCWNGDAVRVAFAIDTHDRKQHQIAHRDAADPAGTGGPGEDLFRALRTRYLNHRLRSCASRSARTLGLRQQRLQQRRQSGPQVGLKPCQLCRFVEQVLLSASCFPHRRLPCHGESPAHEAMSASTRARRSTSRSTGSREHATSCCADRPDSVIHAGNSARVRSRTSTATSR